MKIIKNLLSFTPLFVALAVFLAAILIPYGFVILTGLSIVVFAGLVMLEIKEDMNPLGK